jgi:hypothetical protein
MTHENERKNHLLSQVDLLSFVHSSLKQNMGNIISAQKPQRGCVMIGSCHCEGRSSTKQSYSMQQVADCFDTPRQSTGEQVAMTSLESGPIPRGWLGPPLPPFYRSGRLPSDGINLKTRRTNGNSQNPEAKMCKIDAVPGYREKHGSRHPTFRCTVMLCNSLKSKNMIVDPEHCFAFL